MNFRRGRMAPIVSLIIPIIYIKCFIALCVFFFTTLLVKRQWARTEFPW